MIKRLFSLPSRLGTFYKFSSANHRALHNEEEIACWKCNKKNYFKLLVCGGCKYLQEPSHSIKRMNYFELFNLPFTYFIDSKTLESAYKRMQMIFHPDRHHAMNEEQLKIYSQTFSSYINEAYSILKDDYSRAYYILNLKGHIFEKDSVMDYDEEFLDQIIEVRQEIEECEDLSDLETIKEKNKIDRELTRTTLSKYFENEQYPEAAKLINKLKYLITIDESLDKKHSDLS